MKHFEKMLTIIKIHPFQDMIMASNDLQKVRNSSKKKNDLPL